MLLIFGGGSELKVEGYIDSDFIADVDDRSLHHGASSYVIMVRLAERVPNSRSLQIRS